MRELIKILFILVSCSFFIECVDKVDPTTNTPLDMNTNSQDIPSSLRSKKVIKEQTPKLKKALAEKNMQLGAPIFMRIIKSTNVLELWVQKDHQFKLYKSYPICYFSGGLGPKKKEGDQKSPEGFYYVKPSQLNPNSSFHLSFNIGYPNVYDRAHHYTGSA